MRKLGMILCAVFMFASPATGATREADYDGKDAGCLIYSVGTIKIGMHFTFPYLRVATPGGSAVNDWKGKIEPELGGSGYLKIKNPDFSGEETGRVVVRCLPPGKYSVGGFTFYGATPGGGAIKWSPAHPIDLPFHITSGQATYIGSFMRSPSLGTPLRNTLGAAGFFIIADRGERDLAIARARLRAGMEIGSEVTDVTVFNNPMLRASEP